MVKRILTSTDELEGAPSTHRAIDALNRVALHKMRKPHLIEALCHDIITRVELGTLVRIDEAELQKRVIKTKGKKKRWKTEPEPFTVGEMESARDSVMIREHWSTLQWQASAIRGWAWREAGETLSLIYDIDRNPDQHYIYLDGEIAANPLGAAILIANMKSKLEKLIDMESRQ